MFGKGIRENRKAFPTAFSPVFPRNLSIKSNKEKQKQKKKQKKQTKIPENEVARQANKTSGDKVDVILIVAMKLSSI